MSDTSPLDAAAYVDHVLTTKGLPVTDEERERLIRTLPTMLDMTAALRIPDVRYGSPALIYPAMLER